MNTHRLQLVLDDETYELLKSLRDNRETTYTAIVKRAIRALDYMIDAKDKGCSVQVVDAKGKVVTTIPVK